MRIEDLDPVAKQIALITRRQVERQFERARRRRIAQNLPIKGEWYARWSFYKSDAVEQAVRNFLELGAD